MRVDLFVLAMVETGDAHSHRGDPPVFFHGHIRAVRVAAPSALGPFGAIPCLSAQWGLGSSR